jgi:peptidoglycan hydrolase CwlO-like protein
MVRVIFTHLYVIVMAIIVITTSNILATRYGDSIINGLNSMVSSADNEITEMQDSVKDWNKKMLD